jgi:hypothetical protein
MFCKSPKRFAWWPTLSPTRYYQKYQNPVAKNFYRNPENPVAKNFYRNPENPVAKNFYRNPENPVAKNYLAYRRERMVAKSTNKGESC